MVFYIFYFCIHFPPPHLCDSFLCVMVRFCKRQNTYFKKQCVYVCSCVRACVRACMRVRTCLPAYVHVYFNNVELWPKQERVFLCLKLVTMVFSCDRQFGPRKSNREFGRNESNREFGRNESNREFGPSESNKEFGPIESNSEFGPS